MEQYGTEIFALPTESTVLAVLVFIKSILLYTFIIILLKYWNSMEQYRTFYCSDYLFNYQFIIEVGTVGTVGTAFFSIL